MASDDLRSGVVRAAERFADDLLLGRHGDPQVGFVVLVHPDQEPTIVALTPAGAGDVRRIDFHENKDQDQDQEERQTGPRFFTADELAEAAGAFNHANHTLRMAHWDRRLYAAQGRTFHLGRHIGERITDWWQRHRSGPVEQALRQAADEARRPAKCPHCGRRFTYRGLGEHLRRNRVCSLRETG